MEAKNGLKVGTVLQGQLTYTIKEVLGQGGFGITYRAMGDIVVNNIETTAEFAIKEFFLKDYCERESDEATIKYTSSFADTVEQCMKDFETEAYRLNNLPKHPGIVKVNEVFRSNGTMYYVMQYLGGDSLSKRKVPMPEAEAIEIIKQVADALSFLHKERINHLDIKPDNILLQSRKGKIQPVIIDFGISKHFNSKGNATTLSRSSGGATKGFSPVEQYGGTPTFRPESDVYSLAATLFYLLSGKLPEDAFSITPEFIDNNLPTNTAETVRNAIHHAMQKLVENRTKSTRQFIDELYLTPKSDDRQPTNPKATDYVAPQNTHIIDNNRRQKQVDTQKHSPVRNSSATDIFKKEEKKNHIGRILIYVGIIVVAALIGFGIMNLLSTPQPSEAENIVDTLMTDSISFEPSPDKAPATQAQPLSTPKPSTNQTIDKPTTGQSQPRSTFQRSATNTQPATNSAATTATQPSTQNAQRQTTTVATPVNNVQSTPQQQVQESEPEDEDLRSGKYFN